jgi:hypothetical protein
MAWFSCSGCRRRRGVLYADMVGADQAPHTPRRVVGPAQHISTLVIFFSFSFFLFFFFLRFSKADSF